VPTNPLERALDQVHQLKTQFGPRQARQIELLLKRVARLQIEEPNLLIRLHELLLFIRAYPHNSKVLKLSESILRTIPERISKLLEAEVDLVTLEHPELSGMAGMSVTDTFSFPIVSWLQKREPSRLSVFWDWFEDENRIGETWPRFIPLLQEDTFVEANIPFRKWLRNARGKTAEVEWLMKRFSGMGASEPEKAELYNSQKLYVQWRYSYRDSRTGMRGPVRKLFFHDAPLIQRRDVRLTEEFSKPTVDLNKLSFAEGQRAIDDALRASTVRYRELYGFTNADFGSVSQTSLGRGVELVLFTLPPDRRLPLRAYHAVMIYKNGVPIGYFEGLSLFDRMESGFNLYYTFREGETAWLYARVLHVMRQLTGVSSFALDPYQIGHENEEGIQSGAFWFYRKLGFRSTRDTIRKLSEIEETKISSRTKYRTASATLRKLAEAPMILDLDEGRKGDWDQFQVRNVGLAVQHLMAAKFNGEAQQIREQAVRSIMKLLDLPATIRSNKTFIEFAVVLLLIPDLKRWSDAEKALLSRVILQKCRGDEGRYLRLMQKHARLRDALINLGSSS